MLDIKYIRENKEAVREAIKNKNIVLNLDELLATDEKRRALIQKSETLRAEQKKLGKEDIAKAKCLKEDYLKLSEELKWAEQKFEESMVKVPTVPSSDTPIGKNSDDNKEVLRWGKIPQFKFEPKDHIALGRDLDILDLERGAKVAGYRGYYLKNEGAILALALMFYVFQKMVKKGFAPMIPPTLVNAFALFGSGYFAGQEYNPEQDEIYQIASADKESSGAVSGEKKFLVGTAEPVLLAYHSNETLKEADLPKKICGFSQCYRSEIGSYGKDTKGIYRVHEFMKVEQVVLCRASIEESTKLQDEMLKLSRELHEDLGLPYRVLQICTGDMSPGKYRAFDIETWLAGTKRWAETGSASNFLDWQARRLNVRYLDKKGETKFVYMLNNTALATPRTLMAILENFQQKDGSVAIPKVLRGLCSFKKISPKKL